MDDGSEAVLALELNSVSKAFDGNVVLGTVNVAVATGEFVAVVGPSGSGKSTLLNMMGLLTAPTEGSIKVFGEETDQVPSSLLDRLRGQQIGFVFQASYLDESRSVLGNTILPLQIAGLHQKAALMQHWSP